MPLALESSVSEPSPWSRGSSSQWPGHESQVLGLCGPEERKWAEASMSWRSQCPPNLSLYSHAGGLPRSRPSCWGGWQSVQPDDTGSKIPALQWGIFQAKAAVSIWFSSHCESGRAEAMAGRYVYPSKEESLFGCFTSDDTMILVTRVRATN